MKTLTQAFIVGSFICGLNSLQAADSPKTDEYAPQTADVAAGTGIKDKVLVGNATVFNRAVGRVYCWSKITTQKLPTTVRHVWYVDGNKIAELPLSVKVSPMRTWSSKAIWPGHWKVEIVSDSRERILATLEFTVNE